MSVCRDLSHHDADHVLYRINPKNRAPSTTPAKCTRSERVTRGASIIDETKPKSKGISRSANLHIILATMIAAHEVYCLGTQQPHPIQLTTIQQHLAKAPIVGDSG